MTYLWIPWRRGRGLVGAVAQPTLRTLLTVCTRGSCRFVDAEVGESSQAGPALA